MDPRFTPTSMTVVKLDGGSDEAAAAAADTGLATMNDALTSAGATVDGDAFTDVRSRLRIVGPDDVA